MKLWLKGVGQAFLYFVWFAWLMGGVIAVVLLEWWGIPILIFSWSTGLGTLIWSLEK